MIHKKNVFCVVCVFTVCLLAGPALAEDKPDAGELVKASFDYYRGEASIATVEMVIHRPDWERRMTIEAWTKGEKNSLFCIKSPAKDAGNGTLKKGRQMWVYNPKVRRAIKLPPSMMSQSWMGSDFSNNDLAKSDTLISNYTHRITGTETRHGKTVYLVTSTPKPGAPEVWGMQKLKIREDLIFLREAFYDEDMELVKAIDFYDIKPLGGRLYPSKMKMQKADTKDTYTLIQYHALSFLPDLPDRIFTLSNLTNPGR